MPRLVAPYFVNRLDGSMQWPRLARVLDYSASQYCPGWDRRVEQITPYQFGPQEVHRRANPSHVHNTQKMIAWCDAVLAAPDGARVLLLDVDTLIVQSLDVIWTQPFDFAYTVKQSRFPFNSGVTFLRVSDRTRAFMQWWRDENVRMLRDEGHHLGWRAKFGGINQAALGRALRERLTGDLQVLELPCAEWNCEDSSWAAFSPSTRIVHVKSALRRAVFGREAVTPVLRPLVARWRQAEQALLGAVASA